MLEITFDKQFFSHVFKNVRDKLISLPYHFPPPSLFFQNFPEYVLPDVCPKLPF